jgi:hypothetical protein
VKFANVKLNRSSACSSMPYPFGYYF